MKKQAKSELNDPLVLLRKLLGEARGTYEIGFEEYYDIFRYRHNVTQRILRSKDGSDFLVDALNNKGASRFLRILDEFELLKVLFPAIYALKNVDGGHYHDEEVLTHVLGAYKALEGKNLPLYVKLASLYHDCGKNTFEKLPDGRTRFTNHAQKGAFIVIKELKELGLPNDVVCKTSVLVNWHMQQVDGGHSVRKLKKALDQADVPFKYFMWVRYSDNKGSMKAKTDFMYYWRLYRQCWRILRPKHIPSPKDLCISGNDLMRTFGKPAGPWIGIILKELFTKWQQGLIENNTRALLEYSAEMEESCADY